MYLRAVRIRQRLEENVAIALMPKDVVARARYYGLGLSFYLAAGLRKVSSGYEVFST